MANIKRNLVYNFLLSASNMLLPLLSIPYLSRVLDPEGIGRVGFIDSFTYYFVIIAEFGITTYGIRAIAACRNDQVKLKELVPQLLTLHLISSLVTAVFYIVSLVLLWHKFEDSRLVFFSIAFFAVNFFACEWYFMGRERFGYIALRSVAIRLLGLLAIFLFIHAPRDYYLYYAAIAGSAVLTGIWNYLILLREIPVSFKKVQWKHHLRYVWVTYFISLVYSVPLILDNVLLGLVSTAGMIGLYSLSAKMVRIATTLLTDSFLVFFPRVVWLSDESDKDQLDHKLSLNIQFIVVFAIPMGMGIFLLADDLATVFFGKKFLDAAFNLRVLALFPLVKGISLFLSNPVLIARHKEKPFLKNLVLSSSVFVVSCIVLSYYYGAPGTCVALITTECLLMILNMVSVKRLFPGFKISSRPFYQALTGTAAFIPLLLLIRQLMDPGTLRLALMILSSILVYCVLMIILKNEFVRIVFSGFKQRFIYKTGTQ